MRFEQSTDNKNSLCQLESWILLSKMSSAGFSGVNKLLKEFGSPEKIFSCSLEKLSQISKINKRIINFIKNEIPKLSLSKDYELIEKLKIKLITGKDLSYPDNLSSIFHPPFLLYLRGDLKKEDEIAVAIVGTRRATNYGKIAARKIARELAKERITVVSGMARGIDTCAHEGALEEGGRTIAILGCGVDIVYPRENKSLMEQIIKQGAVISEFSLGTKPFAGNFPRRNRIISGLSRGVVVVEAPLKSGALITADFALEQGREVFSVPGVITNPYSKGTNKLIKEGAKVVESVYDILEELGISSLKNERKFHVDYQLSFGEKAIFDHLTLNPSHIDDIIEKSGFPVAKVADILMKLQLKKMVRELPGKLFLKES